MELGNKKILIITHYSGVYGANISLAEYLECTQIPRSNFLVIIPHPGPFENILKNLNIAYEIHWFEFNASDSTIPYIERTKIALKRIKKILTLYNAVKHFSPSVIYSNSSVIYYGFFIARLLGVPHLWHIREFGYLDYNLLPDFGFRFQRLLFKLNYNNIAISNAIALYHKLRQRNTVIIYNGVIKGNMISSADNLPNISFPLKFGVVGLIIPYKNQLKIIKAFKQFHEKYKKASKLYIIGIADEKYLKEIKGYITEEDLQDDIIFCGHIDDRTKIYGIFDILVVGSEHEGFGRTTAEAMSFGKIPIGYNGAGTKEVIKDNVTGLLFDNFDELPKIFQKLSEDAEYTEKLRRSVVLNFNKQFTTEYYSAKIDEIILKTL
nr:glycosyltransferase [uncultured Pedobacter sp.]